MTSGQRIAMSRISSSEDSFTDGGSLFLPPAFLLWGTCHATPALYSDSKAGYVLGAVILVLALMLAVFSTVIIRRRYRKVN